MATFTSMLLVNDRLVWRDKTVTRALELWCTWYTCFYVFRMETTGVRQGICIMHSGVMHNALLGGDDSVP